MTGIAKGAGMIAPNMATMLGFIATDAPIAAPAARSLVGDIAAASFNRITIDGDTSTNDSFVLFSTHRAPVSPPVDRATIHALPAVKSGDLRGSSRAWHRRWCATAKVRPSSSQSLVEGGRDAGECDRVARAIAHSPLVKTAFFASDPNLGRIVCAIGNAEISDLDPARVVLARRRAGRGRRCAGRPPYREEDGKRVMAGAEISIRVALGRGPARATLWTCDLSHDYVRINADYRS